MIGERYSVSVPAAQYAVWLNGELIQNPMPQLSKEQREFVVSSTTPAEWDELFSRCQECDSEGCHRPLPGVRGVPQSTSGLLGGSSGIQVRYQPAMKLTIADAVSCASGTPADSTVPFPQPGRRPESA
jgi:hypothetical protein